MAALATIVVFTSVLALSLLFFVFFRLFWLLNRNAHRMETMVIASLPLCLYGLGVCIGTMQGSILLLASNGRQPLDVTILRVSFAAILLLFLAAYLAILGARASKSLRPVLWTYGALFLGSCLLWVFHLLRAYHRCP